MKRLRTMTVMAYAGNMPCFAPMIGCPQYLALSFKHHACDATRRADMCEVKRT